MEICFSPARAAIYWSAETGINASGCRMNNVVILLAIGVLMSLPFQARGGGVRSPAVAGLFYERMPVALERQVEDLLKAAAPVSVTGRLVAAVVPHAGYVYSGRCAASAYALVSSGAYERVVLIAPAHHAWIDGISLPAPDCEAYETPLGRVPIDKAVCDALRSVTGFGHVPGADAREHAIEVHLPFLQKRAGAFKLVPLVCGRMTPDQIMMAARALAPYASSGTLFLASSDFTHYGAGYNFVPFTSDVPGQLAAWLDRASGFVAALDAEGFARHCRETGDTICGAVPIRILMQVLRESGLPVQGRVLSTDTSGRMTGRYDSSVSYASVAFLSRPADGGGGAGPGSTEKEGDAVKEKRSGDWTPGLSAAEQQTLFAIARDTLRWCVEGGRGKFRFDGYTITPLMKTPMATFVTLKIKGHLRGCIGSLAPEEPLYLSVHGNAINAALRDPRFMPVAARELPLIEVDVSLLSPIRDIASVAEFKVGNHGIILEKGRHRAVYLPEVAVEQGWSLEETLSSLSLKAGMEPDAWREGTKFKVFESVVLSE